MLNISIKPETASSEKSGCSNNTQTYAHGESYDGELKNGCRHGKGTYHFHDGSWVLGTWENDNLSGQAIFYHATQQRTDQGTFCGASRKGHGTIRKKGCKARESCALQKEEKRRENG